MKRIILLFICCCSAWSAVSEGTSHRKQTYDPLNYFAEDNNGDRVRVENFDASTL